MSSLSVINRAIESMQARYAGENAAQVATVVAEFKAAQAANKGQNAALFSGFLALAGEHATAYTIRKVGANIRATVTGAMRKAAGLPSTKQKGEKGAPDFSTASVYAGIVADAVDARRENPEAWRAACLFIDMQTDEPQPVHEASGLFASKGALQRTVRRYAEVCEADEMHKLPALRLADEAAESDPAILRTALHAARSEAAELRNLLAERDATIQAMRGDEVTERPALA